MEYTQEQQQALALARVRKLNATPSPPPASMQAPEETLDPEALMMVDSGMRSDPQEVKAVVRNVLQGFTFKSSDEIEAALRSTFGEQGYNDNIATIRQEMKAYSTAKPRAALAQEVAGGLMSPGGYLKGPKYIQQAAPLVRGGAKGGTGGFVYGVGGAEGDLSNRVEEGFVGAGIGLFIGAPLEKLASTLGNAAINSTINRQKIAPTVENLKNLRDEAYAAVDQGVTAVGPDGVQQILNRASAAAQAKNYVTLDRDITVVDRAQKMIESKLEQGLTLGQAELLRRSLFRFVDDPRHGHIVRDMIEEFDDVIENSFAKSESAAMQLARGAHMKYAKVRTLNELFDKVDLKGKNVADGYKAVAIKLLSNPKQLKYFTTEEQQLLNGLVNGTLGEKTLDFLGKFAPTANGLMGAVNLTAMAHNAWFALATLGVTGAKFMSDKKTIAKAKELIKQAGGLKAVREASEMPNAATLAVGGITADSIRQELGIEIDERTSE